MTLQSLLARPWLTLSLVAFILITRINYSSAIIDTPDVTLAAFFIAGLWIPGALVFALLFGAAALADQLSFALGISDWCFTPAYVFLVPTYACPWLAGYFCRKIDFLRIAGAAKLAIWFVLACVAAYAISTYSFFLFSGRLVNARTIAAYEQGILHYFPYYIGWASAYTLLALAIATIVRWMKPNTASDSERKR